MNDSNLKGTIHDQFVRRLCLVLIGAAVIILAGCSQSLHKVSTIPTSSATITKALSRRDAAIAAPGEELWVIGRTRSISNSFGEPISGCGSMLTEVGRKQVPMPLKKTDVQASILGYIATVKVLQQFHNPHERKIEAVYVFPLPENAAVNEFIMTIGDRRIRGIIREREEAEKIYLEAKSQGYVASLLTQERPNIFTQSVANIEPGRAIDVAIQYFHTLAYADGWYEFVFPMVVGPRFNPPGVTDGVGAGARTNRGTSAQKTEVPYLRPGERSGHDISLAVDIHAGVEIEETACRSHEITVARPSPQHTSIRLSAADSIPNKDFVLRYRVAGDCVKASLVTHRDERGGFFTLMLYPPAELHDLPRHALELVFVLDCSGSMSGRPIAQARAAIEHALHRLQPGDSFQLISFSETSSKLGPVPVEATADNVRRGLSYLGSLKSEGGTVMIEGVKTALDFPHDPQRLRFVVFLTDGYIGNEAEILREIHRRLGASRIFSFGVGSAPNYSLLDGMARAGRGAVAYLTLNDDAPQGMDTFFDYIRHPALTDVRVNWNGTQVNEVYPQRIPDLFVGRPVILTGRFTGEMPASIRVTGRLGSTETITPVATSASGWSAAPAALPSVWARMKIADLGERWLFEQRPGLPAQIKQLALDFNLMSEFTAFIAVDSTTRTADAPATTAPVAVPVPEGVDYDKTLTE